MSHGGRPDGCIFLGHSTSDIRWRLEFADGIAPGGRKKAPRRLRKTPAGLVGWTSGAPLGALRSQPADHQDENQLPTVLAAPMTALPAVLMPLLIVLVALVTPGMLLRPLLIAELMPLPPATPSS
jgi:hypothetical protein